LGNAAFFDTEAALGRKLAAALRRCLLRPFDQAARLPFCSMRPALSDAGKLHIPHHAVLLNENLWSLQKVAE
jgi:hypothetical protein